MVKNLPLITKERGEESCDTCTTERQAVITEYVREIIALMRNCTRRPRFRGGVIITGRKT